MRLLAWNLNHRGSPRFIAPWIAQAILRQDPSVVVLTEYIEGRDHATFLKALGEGGLHHTLISQRGADNGIVRADAGQKELHGNQVLIAARFDLVPGEIRAPALDWLAPNVLHARMPKIDLDVLGFRMPSYKRGDPNRRKTWEWLLPAANKLVQRNAIIAGDFNTAPGDSTARCGDSFDELAKSTWQRAAPTEGWTFLHRSKRKAATKHTETPRCIDHMFFSPSMIATNPKYLWDFVPADEPPRKFVRPDHAMLVADFALPE